MSNDGSHNSNSNSLFLTFIQRMFVQGMALPHVSSTNVVRKFLRI